MSRIMPNITTLEQHHQQLQAEPEQYFPDCCPHCGKTQLWSHGVYFRYPDRGLESQGVYNPCPIPRFFCPACKRTCSRLPECIPPRRWYLWIIQQQMLLAVLCGQSFNAVSQQFLPSRRTLTRWWGWLDEKSQLYRFRLATFFPQQERYSHFETYWQQALKSVGLSKCMATLDRTGVIVP
ncbi:hypothetical protein D5085_00840 [Ectothiorhodospiraceae bacterium BW-2]|nr:hypothetical protein D5085_00840 [Ectothiorhodospiraceae bacterium BW-2]